MGPAPRRKDTAARPASASGPAGPEPHPHALPPGQLSALRRRLVLWYEKNQRPLPWRRTRDPYRIWVSEVMLQQTQVTTVIPYYQRFIERFADVAHLARAELQEVLKSWEGLGYYTRARNFHRAAKRGGGTARGQGSRRPGGVPGASRRGGLHRRGRVEHRLRPALGRGGRQRQAGPGASLRHGLPRSMPPAPTGTSTRPRPCCSTAAGRASSTRP